MFRFPELHSKLRQSDFGQTKHISVTDELNIMGRISVAYFLQSNWHNDFWML